VLVVLDTNAFHSDVHATRPRLRGILDAPLNQAAFEVFVPEVVLRELDKQFARRSKKVVRDMNKAFGDFKDDLAALGMVPLERRQVDGAAVEKYRHDLEVRLSNAAVTILPTPEDLSPAIEWAVNRRKPFKDSGEGLPDAVIWLSVLELACTRPDPILFVSSNWKDFADAGSDSVLAAVLKEDLRARKRPGGQVRLAPGIAAFADEVAETASLEAARNLASAGAFDETVEAAVLFSRLDREILSLDVPLDSDPQVTALDVEWLEIDDAAELPGGDILVHASAEMQVELDLLIDRSDYYSLSEAVIEHIHGVNATYNERYVQAETSATLRLSLTITSTADGTTSQTQIDTFSLASVERIQRALRGRAGAELVDELRASLDGHTVENYIAEEPIESDLDEVSINTVTRIERVRLTELLEEDGETCAVALRTSAEADIEWASNAPTAFDADRFASLALNESSDAPILQDFDIAVPVDVRFTARYDDEHGWHGIELDQVTLEEDERERRSSRPTTAEVYLCELEHPDDGQAE
jgi:hypothetical protein